MPIGFLLHIYAECVSKDGWRPRRGWPTQQGTVRFEREQQSGTDGNSLRCKVCGRCRTGDRMFVLCDIDIREFWLVEGLLEDEQKKAAEDWSSLR
jgi:ribosomal protein S14